MHVTFAVPAESQTEQRKFIFVRDMLSLFGIFATLPKRLFPRGLLTMILSFGGFRVNCGTAIIRHVRAKIEMKAERVQPSYSTPDLHIAAFLQESGFNLLRTDREGQRVVFTFEDPMGTARQAAVRYFNGAQVVAVRFSDTLRRLKGIVMRGM